MYYSNKDIRIEEMPVPEIEAGEVLVRVEASGICGTDVLEWYRREKVPLVLGHEVAGTIVKKAKDVKEYKEGDRVFVAHHVPCNKCHYCINGHPTVCPTLRSTNIVPGGFSQYVRVPPINTERGLYILPPSISFDEATFIEPLACTIRGQRIVGLKPEHILLVLGCGVAGILHIHLARVCGVRCIVAVDINPYRIEAAKRFGADHVLNAKKLSPKSLKELTGGFLANVVIVCTTAEEAFEQAIKCVDRGGTVLFFAPTAEGVKIPLSINEVFWRNEVTLTSSYAGDRGDHLKALWLIEQRRVNVKDMITHHLPLKDIEEGFRLVAEAKESLKVIIEPQR